MSDAISLGIKILEQAGISISLWKHRDIDILDQVVSSLKCNPLLLEIVVPMARNAERRAEFDEAMEFVDALLALHQDEEASDAGAAEIGKMKTML